MTLKLLLALLKLFGALVVGGGLFTFFRRQMQLLIINDNHIDV